MDAGLGPTGAGADYGQEATKPAVRAGHANARTNSFAIVALVLGLVLPPLAVPSATSLALRFDELESAVMEWQWLA